MSERKRYRQIGQRIRQARQQRGWSQRELAEQADISQTAVHHYEQGSRRIGVADLERLAALLGKSMEFFLARSESEAHEPPSTAERQLAEVLGLQYIPLVSALDAPSLEAADRIRDASMRWLPLPRHLAQGADAVVIIDGQPGGTASLGTLELQEGDLLLLQLGPHNPDEQLPALVHGEAGLSLSRQPRPGESVCGRVLGLVHRFDAPGERPSPSPRRRGYR